MIYEFIASRGVSDDFPDDNSMTRLLNIISFITATGALGIFIFAALFTDDYIYMSASLIVGTVYLIMILLHHFNRVDEAKIYFASVIPLWYAGLMICIGGHFSQSICAAATIVITYLIFKERHLLRNSLLLYNVLMFVVPSLYITFKEPVFGVRDYPLDEIVVFLLCLGWISIVFYIYELKAQSLISTLKNKNTELEEKNDRLERFTYLASHDIKSPIRNITSYLGLVKKKVSKNSYEGLEQYIDFAMSGAHQMNELVEGILEVSKQDRIQESANTDVELKIVLEKALANLEKEINEKNAKVFTQDLPVFNCNEYDMIVVFQNIIQNGIKYNKSQAPVIKIEVEDGLHDLKIVFEDNGIGVDEKYHSQIFEFFKRLHSTNEYPGTGLGLGLVKKIIDKYKGDIKVESQKGLFTRFIINLPKRNNIKEINQAVVKKIPA